MCLKCHVTLRISSTQLYNFFASTVQSEHEIITAVMFLEQDVELGLGDMGEKNFSPSVDI